jgi:hypothetical protein
MALTIDKINEIEDYCWRSALVLELQKAFGLRRKEAFLLQPHVADQGAFLALTERGRWLQDEKARVINIETGYQRDVLDKAKRLITNPNGLICGDGLRQLKQAYDRYSKVMKKYGVTEATTSNLRRQFADDMYERIIADASFVQVVGANGDTESEADVSERPVTRVYKDGELVGFIAHGIPSKGTYYGNVHMKYVYK